MSVQWWPWSFLSLSIHGHSMTCHKVCRETERHFFLALQLNAVSQALLRDNNERLIILPFLENIAIDFHVSRLVDLPPHCGSTFTSWEYSHNLVVVRQYVSSHFHNVGASTPTLGELPRCRSIPTMWEYSHNLGVVPHCWSTPTSWDYSCIVGVLPHCGNIPSSWGTAL